MAIEIRHRKPHTAQGVSNVGSPGDAFEVHRQMVIALFAATLVVAIALTLGLIASSVTVLMVATAAGALGGFVSALRRLYAFQRFFPVNFFKRPHKVDLYLLIYSMVPSLVGCIAAVTLYLIFASGLIKGDMFPSFKLSNVGIKSDDFQNFVWNWEPASPPDYAKALVWSFLAGFSERFVPDLLERFSKTQLPGEDPSRLTPLRESAPVGDEERTEPVEGSPEPLIASTEG